MNSKKTYEMLTEHYQKYPKLELRDMFKFIFQSSFGCEHMISSLKTATEYIREEYQNIPRERKPETDKLDGKYTRVHLSYINDGLSVETLGKLFYMSAKKEENAKADLIEKAETLKELVCSGVLPFDKMELEKSLSKWENEGFPAVHHSEAFRREYKPAYRVIANEFIPFLPLFEQIDKLVKKGAATVCIEGGSASGKTTLGKVLSNLYDCNVLHMDDFFLPKEKRTSERFAEAGGNIDHERFLEEVLIPLNRGEGFSYGKFDCSKMSIGEKVQVTPKRLNIIEGAYSMHPNLAPFYDFSVFLDISPDTQRVRIQKRNSPEMAERFFEEWIPLEKRYFKETDIKQRCSLIIEAK